MAPGGIVVERDLPYGRRPAQRLDLYRPAAPGPHPVLVLVHGGAWTIGDKANPGFIDAKVAHWVPRGWIVVSPNYRLLPWAGPLTQAEDVAHALGVVQAQVARWGGDGSRVVVLGHSTGAHLVALVLADPAIGRPFGQRPPQAAVLLDSAALDVVQVMNSGPMPFHERAFGTDPRQWPVASPLHRLATAPPPMLLVCSAERADSSAQALAFATAARGHGGDARVVALPLGHAELNRSLGLPGELTDTVDAFLDDSLRKAQGKPRREPPEGDS